MTSSHCSYSLLACLLLALVPMGARSQRNAPTPRGNLLTNASFESGPGGGLQEPYRGGGWSVRSEGVGRGPGGSRTESLDIRAYRDAQSPAAVGYSALRLTVLPGRNVRVASSPVRLSAGSLHTLSLYLRSDAPGVSVSVGLQAGNTRSLERTCVVGPKWERYTVSGTPGGMGLPVVVVQAENPPEDARPITLWVDGVQLEETPIASPAYLPAFPYEMRVTCDAPGNVFFDTEKIFLNVNVGQGGGREPFAPEGTLLPRSAPPTGSLRVSLLDVTQTVRGTFTVPFPLGERRSISNPRAIRIPDAIRRRPLGIFKARMELFASDGKTVLAAPSECVYARLPRPRALDPARSSFGIHIPLAREYARIAVATGNRWTRLHHTTMTGSWATTEAEPGRFEFFDAGIDAVSKSGMAILGLLDDAPARTTTRPPTGNRVFSAIPDKPDAIEAWARYVRAMVTHYKGRVSAWEVVNEPSEQGWLKSGNPNATPVRYGLLLRRAFQEAHDANPDAVIVGIGSRFDARETWTIPVLAAASPAHFDVFSYRSDAALLGGTEAAVSTETMAYRKAQADVGGPVRPLWDMYAEPGAVGSFYRPDAGGLPTDLQAARSVRFDVTQRAAGAAKVFLSALRPDPYPGELGGQLIEYDRAISPYLAARAVLASFTDGVAPPTGTSIAPGVDGYSYPAQTGLPEGKTVVSVVWASDGAAHLVRVPPKTTVLDVWGNRLSPRGTLTVGAEPVYFLK